MATRNRTILPGRARIIGANTQRHHVRKRRATFHRNVHIAGVQARQNLINCADHLVGTRRVGNTRHHVRTVILRHAQLKSAAHPAWRTMHHVPQPVHAPQRTRQGVGARVRPEFGEHLNTVVVGEADEPLGHLLVGAASAHQQDACGGVRRLFACGGVHAAFVAFKFLGGVEDGAVVGAVSAAPGGAG